MGRGEGGERGWMKGSMREGDCKEWDSGTESGWVPRFCSSPSNAEYSANILMK